MWKPSMTKVRFYFYIYLTRWNTTKLSFMKRSKIWNQFQIIGQKHNVTLINQPLIKLHVFVWYYWHYTCNFIRLYLLLKMLASNSNCRHAFASAIGLMKVITSTWFLETGKKTTNDPSFYNFKPCHFWQNISASNIFESRKDLT